MKKTKLFNIAARNRRAFSELPFELASMLSLQWFCKTPFPDSTYFELNFFIVCYLGELRKKICWMSQQGAEKIIFRVIFPIGVGTMTAMILQNTISRFNLFWIESFDNLESHETKICWMSQQITEKRIFKVIFWIGFMVIFFITVQRNTLSYQNF